MFRQPISLMTAMMCIVVLYAATNVAAQQTESTTPRQDRADVGSEIHGVLMIHDHETKFTSFDELEAIVKRHENKKTKANKNR